MPVVAPAMLFSTVSSVMLCARLDRAQQTLGRLSEVVERVRALLDAEDYARLETAAERIDEIRSEFEHSRRFARRCAGRLARIDHDVGVLRSKYGLLMTGDVTSADGAGQRFRISTGSSWPVFTTFRSTCSNCSWRSRTIPMWSSSACPNSGRSSNDTAMNRGRSSMTTGSEPTTGS